MRPRPNLRRLLSTAVWELGTWLACRRRATPTAEQFQQQLFRESTQRIGVRFAERLRDRLRPGWLRLRRSDADE